MLFDRQKHLLALLDAHNGEVGLLDFQKLLFLYCQEAEESPYDFVPYKYGGFSFTSYSDKRKLTEQGLLADEEQIWKLTGPGKVSAAVAPLTRMKMDQFAKRHKNLRGNLLVAEAYRRYPYYAVRSEIAERVLAGDTAALQEIDKARPSASSAGLFTIGYEGRSLEKYLNLLVINGVTLLCDVRRNPLSRKYGFSKGTLSKSCVGVGIRYEHLPELGIATEKRRGLDTQAAYDQLFLSYERDSLPNEHEALIRIQQWIDSGDRVALTCYESLPEQCHRHCVAEALAQKPGSHFSPEHL
ncbi:MAG TPA: DUF488 domain-containing protein [Verrucomicrobiae bacterium]|jgi:uncharacterized protein (DUF488 family)|nr:DUF488 domain-containing protein [Verrucomicrobiae bacterium]